ncbi:hypothetical protein KM043_005152 [Ampulex compressa]|nr:hypothetical protein KM043_005152 [Ampulex compressa]
MPEATILFADPNIRCADRKERNKTAAVLKPHPGPALSKPAILLHRWSKGYSVKRQLSPDTRDLHWKVDRSLKPWNAKADASKGSHRSTLAAFTKKNKSISQGRSGFDVSP